MASTRTELQNLLKDLEAKGTGATVSFRHAPLIAPLLGVPLKKDRLGFEYAEHTFLGDGVTLQLAGSQSGLAANLPIKLPNGLLLTYGQINGLAGDFYGTTEPISDGATPKDQQTRFSAAWAALGVDTTRQPGEATSILQLLLNEVDQINQAFANHEDPSKVYATLPDESVQFTALTIGRPSNQPSYAGLALINWDHFGTDARTAYDAGHTVALQKATEATDQGTLLLAYAMNAFADHFLEDSFSAGHTRTPRRQLHSKLTDADNCAKLMHDEDNAIGLDVVDPQGAKWKMYGDKRLLDSEDDENRKRCQAAVQTSANEIFAAWKSGTIPPTESYGAWQYAPTLESARANTQELAPLFTFEDPPQRRADIKERRKWSFTSNYWYATTYAWCIASGLWKYPIHIETKLESDGNHENVGGWRGESGMD